ncbi:hypothetical protein [Neptuniibacter sp. QD37_11]|uniref:hypothetical protein n=1 Tax=Neptuniibacter sp. QD37_11 TaxID=3398209 RepID=UPI0039F538D4
MNAKISFTIPLMLMPLIACLSAFFDFPAIAMCMLIASCLMVSLAHSNTKTSAPAYAVMAMTVVCLSLVASVDHTAKTVNSLALNANQNEPKILAIK